MPVPTGVVCVVFNPAGVAFFDVATKIGGPTVQDIVNGFEVGRMELVLSLIVANVISENVRQLNRRLGSGLQRFGA